MADVGQKTGRYWVNPKTGVFEKLGTRPGFIPHVSFDDVTCPTQGYVSENMGHEPVVVKNRRHKRDLLRSRGLREA